MEGLKKWLGTESLKDWLHATYSNLMGKERYDVLVKNRCDLLSCLAMLDALNTKDQAVVEQHLRCEKMLRETEDELQSYYGWSEAKDE